ncbi:hypothetical protein D3C73_1066980 [compost metagenome]
MGRDASAADFLHQGLGHHRQQRLGEHRAHHRLLVPRKHIDHPVDGFRRRRGVQRAEHQMAGFGRGQRQANGFQIAHLPHQDHIRVFPQCRTQGGGETTGITMDFTLIDQAFARLVNELDGVFDGEDVVMTMGIEVIDHRRQRGGLAGTGRAGYQHQATGSVGHLAEHVAHAQFIHALHFRRDGAKHRARATVLVEHIDPKTRHAGYFKGKVGFQMFFELHPLGVIHDGMDQSLHLLVIQGRQIDASHITVDANHRRQAGGQVQIGCPLFGAECQQLSDIHSASQFQ